VRLGTGGYEEITLADAFDDALQRQQRREGGDEEMNYSYALLAQSDGKTDDDDEITVSIRQIYHVIVRRR
jgi:hypothetical protein